MSVSFSIILPVSFSIEVESRPLANQERSLLEDVTDKLQPRRDHRLHPQALEEAEQASVPGHHKLLLGHTSLPEAGGHSLGTVEFPHIEASS